MQSRLVRLPAVAAELLRRVSLASILRASIRADERFCFRSFRGELRGFTWITFGGLDACCSRRVGRLAGTDGERIPVTG
jgi:hypothetical protein